MQLKFSLVFVGFIAVVLRVAATCPLCQAKAKGFSDYQIPPPSSGSLFANPYDHGGGEEVGKGRGGLAVRPLELPKINFPSFTKPKLLTKQLANPLKPVGDLCSCKVTVPSPAIVPKPATPLGLGSRFDKPSKLLQKLTAAVGAIFGQIPPTADVAPPTASYEGPILPPSPVLPPVSPGPVAQYPTFNYPSHGAAPPSSYAMPPSGSIQVGYAPSVVSYQPAVGPPSGYFSPPSYQPVRQYPLASPGMSLDPSLVVTSAGFLPRITVEAGDPVPVPSDPVSLQLALKAQREADAGVKILEDKLSFGFRSMPKDGTVIKRIRNIKEENLQAMNGIVVALQPPTILQIEKSLDDEAEDALLDGKVVRTEPIEVIQPAGKKPTLGEIGFGPANIQSPPIFSIPGASPPPPPPPPPVEYAFPSAVSSSYGNFPQPAPYGVPGAPSPPCNEIFPGQVQMGTIPKQEQYVLPAPPLPPCSETEEAKLLPNLAPAPVIEAVPYPVYSYGPPAQY